MNNKTKWHKLATILNVSTKHIAKIIFHIQTTKMHNIAFIFMQYIFQEPNIP